MHPYLPHLLEDLLAAHKTETFATRQSNSFEQVIEEIEQLREGPGHTLGYYCGLNADNFPPSEQLLKKDMKLVCSAFKKMLLTWNVKCHLPKKLPPDMVYSLLIKILERRFDPTSSFSVTFSFCHLNPLECVLKEYCSCLAQKKSSNAGGFTEVFLKR